MPSTPTEKLIALMDFRVDIKALDETSRVSRAAIRINKGETHTLFSSLASMRLGKVAALELVSMSSNSTFTISHNPTIKHNVMYISFELDRSKVDINMSIRTLSLGNWVDRLSAASCSEDSEDSPNEPDKVYKSDGLPTISVGMYGWML